jgi:hypothetical protein
MDATKTFVVLPEAPAETFHERFFDWWGNDDGTGMAGDRTELLERFQERSSDVFSGAYRGLTVEMGVHDGSGSADGIPEALDDYPTLIASTETSTQFEHDDQFRGSEAAANVERLLELVHRLYAFCCMEAYDPEYVFGVTPGSLQHLYTHGVAFTPDDLEHDRVTEFFWLQVFTPGMVDRLGAIALEAAPAWQVERFADGAAMMVTRPSPRLADPINDDYGGSFSEHFGI